MIRLLFNIQSIKHEETDRLYQTVLEDGCLIKNVSTYFLFYLIFFFTFWMSSLS